MRTLVVYSAVALLSIRHYGLHNLRVFHTRINNREIIPQSPVKLTTQNDILFESTINLCKDEEQIISFFKSTLSNYIGHFAINTCSHYCDELQKHGFSSNIVNKNWMLGYLSYKDKGFEAVNLPDNFLEKASTSDCVYSKNSGDSGLQWHGYIERMIHLDPINITVITAPSKGMFPEGSPMRMKYIQRVEPRKVASKLLEISQCLIQELAQDLRTVEIEHAEAERYARTLIFEGKEAADRKRRSARMVAGLEDSAESPDGTPYRERNWAQVGLVITQISTMLARLALASHSNSVSKSSSAVPAVNNEDALELLHRFVDDSKVFASPYHFSSSRSDAACSVSALQTSSEAVTTRSAESVWLAKRRREEVHVTRNLLESLLVQGYNRDDVSDASSTQAPSTLVEVVTVNRLARLIMQKRILLASIASKLLVEEDSHVRSMFTLIKQCGGFVRLDLGKRPIYTVVNIMDVLRGAARTSRTEINYGDRSSAANKTPLLDAENSVGEIVLKETVVERLSCESAAVSSARPTQSSSKSDNSASSEAGGFDFTDNLEYSDGDGGSMFVIPMPGCDSYTHVMFL